MTPKLLTEYRSALVNNQFLATVSCSLDLHKHLDHMSVPLSKSLMVFSSELEKKLELLKTDLDWIPRKKRKGCISDRNFRSSVIVSQQLQRDQELNISESITDCPSLKDNNTTIDDAIIIDDESEGEINVVKNIHGDRLPCLSNPQEQVEDDNLEDIIIIDDEEEVIQTKVDTISEKESIIDYPGTIIDLDCIDDIALELCVNDNLVKKEVDDSIFVCESAEQLVISNLKDPGSDDVEILENDQAVLNNTDAHGLKPFFWDELICAPKAAGDIYESLLGAIYLDSGLNIQAVYSAIEKTIINRWWSRFELSRSLNSGHLDKNPISEFLTLINKTLECTLTKIRYFYKSDLKI